jgi:hypothetical protein
MIERFRIADAPVYHIGSFDKGITVRSQQIRALNLAWGCVESQLLDCSNRTESRKSIAIIGAGISGLTFAGALLRKGANVSLTLIEQRDTLLPLQEGSDTRWLHPRIYDWPDPGSEAGVAMLPLFNWRAGRASDVVVTLLSEWESILEESFKQNHPPSVELCLNAKHVRVLRLDGKVKLEWSGETQQLCSSEDDQGRTRSEGRFGEFDHLVLCTGFGVEQSAVNSYWRNENLGQPLLSGPRRRFLISGQGDGAMIDLLRVRISKFRQDRILHDLFEGCGVLIDRLRRLKQEMKGSEQTVLFLSCMDECASSSDGELKKQFERVVSRLRVRLRRDTEAILGLKASSLTEMFNSPEIKLSFQNRLLAYLLFQCGGFHPVVGGSADNAIKALEVPSDGVIRRHGVNPVQALASVLPGDFVKKQFTTWSQRDDLEQADKPMWPGGYFGFRGSSSDAKAMHDDQIRATWRKEYLPSATRLIAHSLCIGVRAVIEADVVTDGRLRITFHRSLSIGDEEVLQQACDYVGRRLEGNASTAGRTFPASNATIGLARETGKIIRTRKGTDPKVIAEAMQRLNLADASRKMSSDVCFVCAVPLLEPVDDFHGANPVAGVLYIDSVDQAFFLDDEKLRKIVAFVGEFVAQIDQSVSEKAGEIRRFAFSTKRCSFAGWKDPDVMAPDILSVLGPVGNVDPPSTNFGFEFNFEHSDVAHAA